MIQKWFIIVVSLQILIPQNWSSSLVRQLMGEGYKPLEVLVRKVRSGMPEFPLSSMGHQFMPSVTQRPPVSELREACQKFLGPIPDLPDMTTNLAQRRNNSSSYHHLLGHSVCQGSQAEVRRCHVVEVRGPLTSSPSWGIPGRCLDLPLESAILQRQVLPQLTHVYC